VEIITIKKMKIKRILVNGIGWITAEEGTKMDKLGVSIGDTFYFKEFIIAVENVGESKKRK
jgi:hypothetical protein